MVSDLLRRPSITVLATVRNPSHDTAISLKSLPLGNGSRLVIVPLDEAQKAYTHATLHHRLAQENVHAVDVVVANAGASPSFDNLLNTDPNTVKECMEANTIGPLLLFQACWPLLDQSDATNSSNKKFVLITSSTGSIGVLEHESFPNTAYGISKAGANWLAKKISVDFKDQGLKVGIIHPG